MEKDSKTRNFLKGEFAVPVLAFLFIVIVFLIYGSITWFGFEKPEAAGQFGDSFGALTAFFTGITLAGLVYTTYLQRKDLLTQIEMLKEQIDENRESRKALEDQARHLYDASRISAIASKVDFFSGALASPHKERACAELYGGDASTISQHLIFEMDELLGTASQKSQTFRFTTDQTLEIKNCTTLSPIHIRVMHSGQEPFTFFIKFEGQASAAVVDKTVKLPNHEPIMVANIDHIGQSVTINPTSDRIYVQVTGVKPNWDNIQLRVTCSNFNPAGSR